MNLRALNFGRGKSSRMGRDKAWLEINGQSLLARQVELARAAGATEVFISGRRDGPVLAIRLPRFAGSFSDCGTAGGHRKRPCRDDNSLVAGACGGHAEMSADFLQKTSDSLHGEFGVIPQVSGRIEPLAAFYPKAACDLAVELLGAKTRRGGDRRSGATDFARECVKRKLAEFVEVSPPPKRVTSPTGIHRTICAPEATQCLDEATWLSCPCLQLPRFAFRCPDRPERLMDYAAVEGRHIQLDHLRPSVGLFGGFARLRDQCLTGLRAIIAHIHQHLRRGLILLEQQPIRDVLRSERSPRPIKRPESPTSHRAGYHRPPTFAPPLWREAEEFSSFPV